MIILTPATKSHVKGMECNSVTQRAGIELQKTVQYTRHCMSVKVCDTKYCEIVPFGP